MQELFRPADFVSIQTNKRLESRLNAVADNNLREFLVARVSGLAVGDSFAVESRLSSIAPTGISVEKIHDALGEWMAIAESTSSNGSEYLVFGDSSGYCPVFYAECDDAIIVSDTFMGAVHGLKSFGVAAELDIAHYIATLFPAHPHFDNPSVRRTMSSKIRILGIDDALKIDSSGAQIMDRALLSQLSSSGYEESLERGSQLIRNSINQLSSVQGLQKVLSLSGGVDSRLVLSLITASERVNEFQVSSVDPRTWKNENTRKVVERDIAIANTIREGLGLEWATVGEREFLQFDYRDSINFHQSYKSNFAHTFSAAPGHTVQSDLKITFRGGGGELLRTTLTGERISEQIKNRSWKTRNNMGFPDWYMSRFPELKEERPLVEEYITETFNSVSGDTVTEKLNQLYRNTRNRTHFGHVRQSGSTNNYAFHPLSNPHFARASQMLEFDQRANGKLVRDIYNLNDPSLLDIPFENEQSTIQIANSAAPSYPVNYNSWLPLMDELRADRAKSAPRKGWTANERLVKAPFDKLQSSIAFAAQGTKLLEDFVDSDFKKMIRRVNARAFDQLLTHPIKALSLSAKIASALDVFMPSMPAGDHVRLRTSPSVTTAGTSISKVRVSYPTKTQNGWHNQDLPEISPALISRKSGLEVNVGLKETSTVPYEFAVYLYKNKRRITKSWFSQTTSFHFEADGPGSYSAQVFYRINSAHRTSIGIKTNEVQID